ncbi:hypothetical protein AB0F15_19890 [Amycolatopsis sp. NPDC026612]|uniref:hypothetical protein n=1 Tax=Amycolatopsis sp. NPDC026612 TaxID=3155466 RepID=UPI0033E4736D
MSEPKDPEQLLADALRAQAVFAPQASPPHSPPPAPPAPARDTEPVTDAVPTSAINELPSAYGLLSGASADSLERERAALDVASNSSVSSEAPTTFAPRPPAPEPARTSAQLPAYWILLLAVLLGLAAGSVVGLLTLV